MLTTGGTYRRPVRQPSVDRDAAIQIGRALLYVACFFIPLTAIRSFSGLGVNDFAALGAGLFCLLSMVRDKRRLPPALVCAAVIAFVSSVAVATIVGELGAQAGVGLRMAFNFVLWPLIGLRLLRTGKHLGSALFAFADGCSLSAVVAIGQFAGIDLRGVFQATEVQDLTARFIGLNGQPNGQAGMLAVAFTMAVGAIGYGAKLRLKWLLAVLCLVGIMLSASITGLIAAALGVLLVMLRLGKVKMIFGTALAFGALSYLYGVVTEAIPGLVTPLDRISSATGQTGTSTLDLRMLTIQHGLDSIAANPFSGVGFGSGAGGTYDGKTAVHNMEILAWFQGGPFMLLAILIAIVYYLRIGWKRTSFAYQEVIFCAFLVALYFAQTGPTLYDRFLWVPGALLVVAQQIRRETAAQGLAGTNDSEARAPGLVRPDNQPLTAVRDERDVLVLRGKHVGRRAVDGLRPGVDGHRVR